MTVLDSLRIKPHTGPGIVTRGASLASLTHTDALIAGVGGILHAHTLAGRRPFARHSTEGRPAGTTHRQRGPLRVTRIE